MKRSNGLPSRLEDVVSRLADSDMEAARVIMRRLMWNLNDESGGIGWGSPEAMGEILAAMVGLRGSMLTSCYRTSGRTGIISKTRYCSEAFCGQSAELSEKRPELVREAAGVLLPYLESQTE